MSVPVGDWQWDAETGRLQLLAISDPRWQDLSGTWRLADLARVLDGLSAKHVHNVFNGDLAAVACDMVCADGRSLCLLGGQDVSGSINGVILATEAEMVDTDSELIPLRLVPAYQPIYEITGQRIVGFEALARWDGPGVTALDRLNDRNLAPNMLIQAVDALAFWRARTRRSDLYVQVNVTAQDLSDPSFPDLMSALITGHSLEDGALRLELTEHAALRDSAQVIETAKLLRDRGIRLVLDDFGSGHSSFLWLAHLPADAVKVDAALISELNDMRVQAILSMITQLAETLGLLSVAEGVEDVASLAVLHELGFTHVQGFALGRPMSMQDALIALTESGRG